MIEHELIKNRLTSLSLYERCVVVFFFFASCRSFLVENGFLSQTIRVYYVSHRHNIEQMLDIDQPKRKKRAVQKKIASNFIKF